MRRKILFLIPVIVLTLCISGLSQNAADWPAYARDLASTGFSPLSEITPANVASLKQVCMYPLPENATFESSLVTINGIMYFTTGTYTYAINAADCTLKWRVQHQMQGGGTVRGVAVEGNRLFRGFRDGFVVAYNIENGAQLWATRLTEPGGLPAPVAASPIAWNGMVFVGTSGAERACGCIVAGLDAATGRLIWTFQVAAREGPGSETWPKGVHVGGGSIWSALTIDTQNGLLYAPTGNPGPDFFGDYRPGLNLYTGSVIALDAKTGALRKYYQLVPHDYHDWDQAATPAFVTTKGGRRRAMAGGKDGYLHAIDIAMDKVAWKTPVTSIVNAEAPLTPEGTYFCPGAAGGVEWNGPAFSPTTNLVYVNAVDWCSTVKLDTKPPVFESGKQFLGSANGFGVYDPRKVGWVTAVDADSGVVRWRQETAAPMVAGIAVTASGLVMTGDLNGDFLAFDAATGKILHRVQTRQPIGGGVVTYQVGGKQYVGIAAGLTNAIMQTKGEPAVIVYGLGN